MYSGCRVHWVSTEDSNRSMFNRNVQSFHLTGTSFCPEQNEFNGILTPLYVGKSLYYLVNVHDARLSMRKMFDRSNDGIIQTLEWWGKHVVKTWNFHRFNRSLIIWIWCDLRSKSQQFEPRSGSIGVDTQSKSIAFEQMSFNKMHQKPFCLIGFEWNPMVFCQNCIANLREIYCATQTSCVQSQLKYMYKYSVKEVQ